MGSFAGKRVLVTGGAQGIGLEIARAFGNEGCQIALTDINQAGLEKAKQALSEEGLQVDTYVMDVTNPAQVLEQADPIWLDGAIDILVNNAGIVFGGPFTEVPLEKHKRTVDINVMGVVNVTYAFLPRMLRREKAHVVIISSASGFLGLPYGTTYAASKWATNGFAESLRTEMAELGHHHLKVTCVCPSYISTGLFEGVKAPFLTPILTPQYLARQVVRATAKGKAYLKKPWSVHLATISRGLLPTSLFDKIIGMFGTTQSMKQWRGHTPPESAERSQTH
ncbi:MAG: SDR family NAD(P)-dependent oxidoreductase [Acidobacteria bacterium]|nr:SDR family NAD(P)-dependent oxidoreductase [Acidobacteriota bacterium]MCB9399352.1 SDR family NAD(P)-dependent oxidoreductase [Acidobacteriota bacterium]